MSESAKQPELEPCQWKDIRKELPEFLPEIEKSSLHRVVRIFHLYHVGRTMRHARQRIRVTRPVWSQRHDPGIFVEDVVSPERPGRLQDRRAVVPRHAIHRRLAELLSPGPKP